MPPLHTYYSSVAEWLGVGLQNLIRQFEPVRDFNADIMIIIGDIHRLILEMMDKIEIYDITNENFFQVGDLGLGFISHERDLATLQKLDEFLQSRNCFFYAIRGNHDDRRFWDNRDDFNLSNVILVKDYEVVIIEGKKVLGIGGAISVDRKEQIERNAYFDTEKFLFDQDKLDSACANDIDIVITHFSPPGVWPYVKLEFFLGQQIEPDIMNDLREQQEGMGKLLERIQQTSCKQWFFGHYHKDMKDIFCGIEFRCVKTHGFYEVK